MPSTVLEDNYHAASDGRAWYCMVLLHGACKGFSRASDAEENHYKHYYNLRELTLYDWQKDVTLSEDFDDLLD